MKYFKIADNRKFDFKGRSSRSEFWWLMAHITWIDSCVFLALDVFKVFSPIGMRAPSLGITVIFMHIYLTLVLLSCSVRRLHDCGRSGWWSIVPIVPLIFSFFPSEQGVNKYGPPSTY